MHRVALPHVQPRYALTTYTTVVLFQPCMIGYTQYAQTPEYTQPPDPPRLQDPPDLHACRTPPVSYACLTMITFSWRALRSPVAAD